MKKWVITGGLVASALLAGCSQETRAPITSRMSLSIRQMVMKSSDSTSKSQRRSRNASATSSKLKTWTSAACSAR